MLLKSKGQALLVASTAKARGETIIAAKPFCFVSALNKQLVLADTHTLEYVD